MGQAFRRYFVTGLATLFPVAVTLWLLVKIFNLADGLVGRHLGSRIPGLGLLITVLIILAVGVLSVHFFGRVLFRTIEAWLSLLPIARKILPAVKQISQFFFSEAGGQAGFRRVVFVEYPRPGVYSLAFVTNETPASTHGQPQTLLTLMIPTPPSPLTGPIIFVTAEQTTPLTMSVEEAMKLVVSSGVVGAPLHHAAHT